MPAGRFHKASGSLPAIVLAATLAASHARAGEPPAPALPPRLPDVTVTASAPAAPAGTGSLDLQAALARALGQSPLIDAAKAGTEVFEARLDQAKAGDYPLVTLESIIAPIPAKTGASPTSGHTDLSRWGVFVYAQGSGTLPLYGFGKVQHLKAAARLGVSVGKAREDVARAEVRFRVLKGWFGLSFARETQSIVEEGRGYFERAKRHLAERKAADDPSLDPIDEMKIRVYEAQLKSRELEATRMGTLALGNLRWAVGEDPQAGPDITTRAPESISPMRDPTLAELTEIAVNSRPDLVALRRGVAAGGEEVKARYWAMYPDLNLTGKINYAYCNVADTRSSPFAPNSFNGWYASGGLALRVDLGLGHKLGEWHESQARRRRLEAELADAERGVRLEVETLFHEMQDARSLAESQRAALESSLSWVRSKLDAYEADEAPLRDVLDGLLNFLLARLTEQKSHYDYDVAVAALERASGLTLVSVASASGSR